MKINPEQFAIAVVNSSSPSLSVEDKLELYKNAFTLADEQHKTTSKQKQEENMKALGRLSKSIR
ncbi:hypothetical protein [Listeria newyorkensis]|uniref:hypothetical protein n=1 Tax=Listeria newyorkensis TaxID=1497681 RepID=UPI00051CC834|nr:hypothetical protein [Listeria newyorkensis]KGL44089.1 hypothetical protein EP58_06465 [Listeria newyorkensis]SQC57447.1 Uncharacterised protein [Listeria newyorkensis]